MMFPSYHIHAYRGRSYAVSPGFLKHKRSPTWYFRGLIQKHMLAPIPVEAIKSRILYIIYSTIPVFLSLSYNAGVVGHSTENWAALKYNKVQCRGFDRVWRRRWLGVAFSEPSKAPSRIISYSTSKAFLLGSSEQFIMHPRDIDPFLKKPLWIWVIQLSERVWVACRPVELISD